MLSQFELRLLTSEDEDEVVTFIDEHYSKDNAALFGLQKEDLGELNKFRVKQGLKDNLSLGWLHKPSNSLVALGINIVVKKSRNISVEFYEASGLKLSQGAKDYLTLFECLEANLFEKVKPDKIFYGGFTAIHPQYRLLGLLKPLMEKGFEIANDRGLNHGIATAAHDYVITSIKKSKSIVLNEIKFSEYIDPKTGKKPFEHLQPKASRIVLYGSPNMTSNL